MELGARGCGGGQGGAGEAREDVGLDYVGVDGGERAALRRVRVVAGSGSHGEMFVIFLS